MASNNGGNGKKIGKDVFDNAVLLTVRQYSFGNHRRVRVADLEVGADVDPRWLHASKALVDAPQLAAIKRFQAQVYFRVREYFCVPGTFPLRTGAYVLPLTRVEEVEEYLQAARGQLGGLVAELVAAYPLLIEAARSSLGDVFEEADYPTAEELQASFRLEWSYAEFAAPGKLRRLHPDLFAKTRDEVTAAWQNALQNGVDLMRTKFAEFVQHFAERMSPGEDGKPRVLRNSMLKNIQEFLEASDRNIVGLFQGDLPGTVEELQGLVQKTRDLVGGLSTPALRTDAALRANLAESFGRIKGAVDAQIVTRPARRILLDED